MDFVELLASLSWREILMALIVLLVLYILFTFLSISRLRTTSPMPELSPGEIRNAVRSYAAVQEPEPPRPDAPEVPEQPAKERLREPEPVCAQNEPPAESVDPARIEILEEDLAQLRREIGGLHAEIRTLREENRVLREERRATDKARPMRDTSPFYSDAMQLAAQGRDAADISALCGISRAEAELVVTLAKSAERAWDGS